MLLVTCFFVLAPKTTRLSSNLQDSYLSGYRAMVKKIARIIFERFESCSNETALKHYNVETGVRRSVNQSRDFCTRGNFENSLL